MHKQNKNSLAICTVLFHFKSIDFPLRHAGYFRFSVFILRSWSWLLLCIRGFWFCFNILFKGGVVEGFSKGVVSVGYWVREGGGKSREQSCYRRTGEGWSRCLSRYKKASISLFLLIPIRDSGSLFFTVIRRFSLRFLCQIEYFFRNPQEKEGFISVLLVNCYP